MSTLEIIMIIASIVLLIVSFVLPEKTNQEQELVSMNQEEIRKMIQSEYQNRSADWEAILSEATENVQEETKRRLEYLTNEKIMAINEYSDQVMEGIHKNHNEVMFLYGMMNDKESSLQELLEKISSQERKQEPGKKAEEDTPPDEKKAATKKQSRKNGNEIQDLGKSLDSVFSRLEEREALEIHANANSLQNKEDGIALDEAEKRERILSLYEEGKTVKEIAKAGKFGIGEVKLVVDLYRGGKR